MRRRIVTIIEEYCDDDSCFQDLTLRNNGAEDRLLRLEGGQLDKEIHRSALAAQGGIKELAASPEDQGATEPVVEQRAEKETTSASSNVDVTVQPRDVRMSRLASIKSWFANLSKSTYAESVKYFLPLAVKAVPGWFKVVLDWLRNSI